MKTRIIAAWVVLTKPHFLLVVSKRIIAVLPDDQKTNEAMKKFADRFGDFK